MMLASPIASSTRAAFTLLEVLLASLIASLLFFGLYQAMQVELRQASEGRELIERATLSRAIINRLMIDLAPSMTPPRAKPKSSSDTSSASATTGSATTDTTGQVAEQLTTAIPLQAGVIGQSDRIVLFTSRVPDPRSQPMSAQGQPLPDGPIASDIRRISYWLGDNGGLCRQETPWFSSETFSAANDHVLEDGKTDDDYLIAREVEFIGFEFFDINTGSWVESWDGSVSGPDGMTPLGPPSAIRVSFTIRTTDADGRSTTKDYRHLIPIVTASGPQVMDMMSLDEGLTTDPTTPATP